MKKLFLAVVPFLLFGMTACGGSEDPSSSSDPSSSDPAPSSDPSSSSQTSSDPSSSSPTSSDPAPATDYTVNIAWGEWANDSAKFGIYAYTAGEPSTETKKELVSGTSITIPQASTHFILVRFNSTATEFNWDLKWNQTDDIAVTDIQADKTYTFATWDTSPNGNSTFNWA